MDIKASRMHHIVNSLFWKARDTMRDKVEGLELLCRASATEIIAKWNCDRVSIVNGGKETESVQIIADFLHDLKSPMISNIQFEKSLLSLLKLSTEVAPCEDSGQNYPNQKTFNDIHNIIMGWFIKAVAGAPQSLLICFISLDSDKLIRDRGISLSEANIIRLEYLQAIAKKSYEWLLEQHFIRGHLTWPTTEVQVNIALMGSSDSGKSSLFYRLIHNAFPAAHLQLTGALDFGSFYVDPLCGNVKVKVLVWDASNAMSDTILQKADGVLWVYDASIPMDEAKARTKGDCLAHQQRRKSGRSFPVVLFGNKCERVKRKSVEVISEEEPSHYLGSAVTGENVHEALHHLVCQTSLVKYQRRSVTTCSKYTSNNSGLRLIGNSSIFSWYRLLLPL